MITIERKQEKSAEATHFFFINEREIIIEHKQRSWHHQVSHYIASTDQTRYSNLYAHFLAAENGTCLFIPLSYSKENINCKFKNENFIDELV